LALLPLIVQQVSFNAVSGGSNPPGHDGGNKSQCVVIEAVDTWCITILIIVHHSDQHIRHLCAACFLLSDARNPSMLNHFVRLWKSLVLDFGQVHPISASIFAYTWRIIYDSKQAPLKLEQYCLHVEKKLALT
jgi:hypothetical protein